MNTTLARPLTDFPQFWWLSAGFYFVIAFYLFYSGYRRYRGMGGISLVERLVLWKNESIKGGKESKEAERKILAEIKKNKIYGLSAIFVAIGFTVVSIFSIIGAIIVTNTK